MKIKIETHLSNKEPWSNELAKGIFNLIAGQYRAPSHLKPRSWEEIKPPCFVIRDEADKIVGVSFFTPVTSHLIKTSTTVISKGWRNQGVGKQLNDHMEEEFKKHGYGKITCNIYANNLPSLILKLKQDYLIEGLLRDQDFNGMHEYVLGKQI